LPDFAPLISACGDLAPHMRPGVTVVFESTVHKVADIVSELKAFGVTVNVHDPRAAEAEAFLHYGVRRSSWSALPAADALLVAVAHREFAEMPIEELIPKVKPGLCHRCEMRAGPPKRDRTGA
jgi:UDP-N-acetyl-D-mannosaminuronate dehydrogenase